MSDRIQGVDAPIAAVTAAAETKAAKKNNALDVAAREFEQIFVRAMLKDTPIAGKGAAYGDMAVDALAKSVTAGRGLGLGDLIKHSVELSEKALKDRG